MRFREGGECVKIRIIFSYPDHDTVLIERIGNRGDVYKGGLFK